MDYTCMKRILEGPDLPDTRREIRPNRAVSIAATRGMVIRGEDGTLWLTQEGRSQDYILIPGAEYLSPDERRIVITTLGGSGAVTISRAKAGATSGFHGSPLRINAAVLARIRREARAAPARLLGEWITGIFGTVVKGLRALLTPSGDPALQHVLHRDRQPAFRHK